MVDELLPRLLSRLRLAYAPTGDQTRTHSPHREDRWALLVSPPLAPARCLWPSPPRSSFVALSLLRSLSLALSLPLSHLRTHCKQLESASWLRPLAMSLLCYLAIEDADASTRATSSAPPCQSWSFSLRPSWVARTAPPHRTFAPPSPSSPSHRRAIAPPHQRYSTTSSSRYVSYSPTPASSSHRPLPTPSYH